MSDISFLSEIRKIKPKYLKEKESSYKLKFGERRKIAILFLDLHGFTTLSEFLDPEEIKGVIDEIFTIFSDLIEKYHGYIDKYEGDLIMALFGAKKSTESNVERAIRAAIDIVSYLKKINGAIKDDKHKINLRIGIHYGLVVTGKVAKGRDKDYTVMGDAVNVAERLQSNAPLNSILVSKEAINMSSELFKYRYFDELKLKGREKTIKSYIIEGLKEKHVERWENRNIRAKTYIGRDKELEKIENYYKNRNKGMIIILGEGGIGKSRLANEVYIRNKDHFNILKGHTLSYVLSPFYPVIDISNQIFARKNSIKKLNTIAAKEGIDFQKDIVDIINDMMLYKDTLSDDISMNFIRMVKNAFLKLIILYLKAYAGLKLIFQIEDFHWIDEASLMVFKYLTEEIPGDSNIIFLITTRDDQHVRDWMLKNSLVIHLQPLDFNSRKQLFMDTLPDRAISDEYVDNIVKMSGGNPLYIEEMARVISGDNLSKENMSNLILPDTVEGIILARFDNLSDGEKTILQIASCFGMKFDSEKLKNIVKGLNAGTNDTDKLLEYLVNSNFLKRKSAKSYTFTHFLEKEAIYSTILNYNKKIIHDLIAKYFEESKEKDRYIAEIIYHYVKAGNIKKIIEYFKTAANYFFYRMEMNELKKLIERGEELLEKESDKNFEFDIINAKISYYFKTSNYTKVLEILEDSLMKFKKEQEKYEKLLFKKAMTLDRIGKVNEAIGVLESLIKNKKTKISKFKLYKDLSTYYFHKDIYDKAYKYLKKASKLVTDEHERMLYYDSLSMLYYSLGELNKSAYYLTKEMKLNEHSKDKYTLIILESRIALINLESGRYFKALEHAKKAYNLIKKYGSKKDISMNLNTMGIIYSIVGEFEKSLKCFQEGIEVDKKISYLRGLTIINGNLGNSYMWQENWEKAKTFINEAIKLSNYMKWSVYAEDLKSDLFLCEVMLGNAEEAKGLDKTINVRDYKTLVYKLLLKKLILKRDVKREFKKYLNEFQKVDWTLSNNESLIALFYYLLDKGIKKDDEIKSFLVNNAEKLVKNRKKEFEKFPKYKNGFFMKNTNKILKFFKEE